MCIFPSEPWLAIQGDDLLVQQHMQVCSQKKTNQNTVKTEIEILYFEMLQSRTCSLLEKYM